jgi:hypothetical protein
MVDCVRGIALVALAVSDVAPMDVTSPEVESFEPDVNEAEPGVPASCNKFAVFVTVL